MYAIRSYYELIERAAQRASARTQLVGAQARLWILQPIERFSALDLEQRAPDALAHLCRGHLREGDCDDALEHLGCDAIGANRFAARRGDRPVV